MPLLARLLGRRGPERATPPPPPPPPPPPQPPPDAAAPSPDHRLRYFEFSKEQVRVLLFKECDKSGRKLLFDSSAVQRVSVNDVKKSSDLTFTLFRKKENKDENSNIKNSSKVNVVEVSQGFGYQCTSPTSDVNLLGEMIFGAVAMNFKGMSLKVHILNAPDRLMYTKVFCPSPSIRRHSRIISTNSESTGNNCLNSSKSNLESVTPTELNDSCSRRSSLNYSSNGHFMNNHRNLSISPDMQPLNEDQWPLLKDDSGIHGDFSSQSSVSSFSNDCYALDDCEGSEDVQYFKCFSNFNTSQIGSNLQWRLNRHLYTSLTPSSHLTQNSSSNMSIHPSSCDSQFLNSNSEASTSDSFSSNSNSSCTKSWNYTKGKLGLAIVINLSKESEIEMLKFLMEHGLLVEAALDRLRLAIKNICHERHSFITKMSYATEETAQWLVDLLSGPRLKWPLWLCLAGSPKTISSDKLANEFLRDLCFLLKTMDTKDTYFFMSTLITNVLMYHLGWVNSVSPYNAPIATQQKELDYLNISHPYNPLWAQIGELYGAIGTPPRTSRTLVCSKKSANTVNRILCVLSYFIRCSEVTRYDIDSKNLSWETLDYMIDNRKPENSFRTMESKVNSEFSVSGDCIEMSTFSSNSNLIDVKSKTTDTSSTNSMEIEQTLIDQGENLITNKPKLNKPLKRTKSCNTKLKDSGSLNRTNYSSNVSESSLCSITTLIPSKEDDKREENNLISDSKIFDDSYKDQSQCIYGAIKSETLLNNGDVNKNLEQLSFKNNDAIDSSNSFKVETSEINEPRNCTLMENDSMETDNKKDVFFVLGENESLIGIKKIHINNEGSCKFQTTDAQSSCSKSVDLTTGQLSCSFSQTSLCTESLESVSTKSLQTDLCCEEKSLCKHSKLKKHSGVKFEFDKYPQIVTNYMKSKNLELLDRHMIGKPGNLKIEGYEFEGSSGLLSLPNDSDSCVNCALNAQTLQTPSNASELEFTSDIPPSNCEIQHANEKLTLPVIVEPTDDQIDRIPKIFVRTKLENTIIVNWNADRELSDCHEIFTTNENVPSANFFCNELIQEEKIELPIPLCTVKESFSNANSAYCHPLMADVSDHYISDMVLQGVVCEEQNWENKIKRDLHLQSRSAAGGAVCLYADVDDWTVKIMGFNGATAGMSTLVATMLDTLFHMYKSKVPAKQCLKFIELKLKEFCMRSKTLAEMLLDTDFCDINYLTKTLTLESNDVPLLMAIASTHSPQVALKYGISYR